MKIILITTTTIIIIITTIITITTTTITITITIIFIFTIQIKSMDFFNRNNIFFKFIHNYIIILIIMKKYNLNNLNNNIKYV